MAATAARTPAAASGNGFSFTLAGAPAQASNIEKATVAAKKEVRGAVAAGLEADKAKAAETAAPVAPAQKRQYTEAEKKACSIEAMRRGEECEACQ